MNQLAEKIITDSKFNKLVNDHIANLPKIGDIVKGKVINANKSYILLDIQGMTTGIIRGPEIKNIPEEYYRLKQEEELEAMVIDLENENGQMELSLKAAFVETAWQFVKNAEQNQEIITIKITGANKGGLLTSIRSMPAFLPVSQLIPEHYPRVEGGDKKKILKKLKSFIGRPLSVKIISFDPTEEKIIISERRAWEEIQKKKLRNYKIGDTIKTKVKSVTNFGAFVTFDDDLEGLIHISEFPKTEPEGDSGATTQTQLNPFDEIDAKIIDIKGTKVFLSLK